MSVKMIQYLISSMNRMKDDMIAYPFGLDFGYGLHPMSLLAAAPAVTLPSAHHRSLVRHADHPGHVAKQHGPVTTIGKDGFQVCMDVTQFKPNELQVKVVDNHIVVEGRHEEREDDHGYIMRHFTRRYSLSKGYDADRAISSLSSDGVLTVSVAKPQLEDKKEGRVVHIQQTGPAHLNVKANTNEKDDKKASNGSHGDSAQKK